ncbi:venom acid phosphatase Acph-1-like [Anticarsia gemmatalis]|uniref:venom acid phosphatase Acph-1-like n=1 Tax=Anticarsia gemmatalis TaxID=129554 RepID=UPI003F774732
MGLVLVMVLLVGTVVVCEEENPINVTEAAEEPADNPLSKSDLVLVFAMFRHGDRTPDPEEMDLYPVAKQLPASTYFPYGTKELTNKGKQRSYCVGKYLREVYDGFVSKLYIRDQITIRTTDYSRTKMTALAALAGMFPPMPAQKWDPNLDWQPIPFSYEPYAADDLLYWYNCPRYLQLRSKMYEEPEVQAWLEPYKGLFAYLRQNSGANITTCEDVFFMDNLFQTLKNVGFETPKWAVAVMPQIQELTKIEYAVEFYNNELIKLASGVIMQNFLNETRAAIQNLGKPIEHNMFLIAAHENNVAGFMAAAKVFDPHQPKYGATFALELRRDRETKKYGIAAIYTPNAGGPSMLLPVKGCGGQPICDYDEFVSLVQDTTCSKEQHDNLCNVPL